MDITTIVIILLVVFFFLSPFGVMFWIIWKFVKLGFIFVYTAIKEVYKVITSALKKI